MKLKDILGAAGEREIRKLALPEIRCPTGKAVFESKGAARAHLRKLEGQRRHERGRRHAQAPFRCGYCGKIHLGHKRGAIV